MKKSKLALLEAVLFTTTEPLSIERIRKKLRLRKDEDVLKLVYELRQRYEGEESGIHISDSGGYRLIVKSKYIEAVSDLTPHADLSRGLLRVLAIIAYHEPVKQADIVKVVGNRTYEYVKILEERGLVTSERKSRTKLLITTPHFEEYFGTQKENIKKYLDDTNKEKKEEEKDKTDGENSRDQEKRTNEQESGQGQ